MRRKDSSLRRWLIIALVVATTLSLGCGMTSLQTPRGGEARHPPVRGQYGAQAPVSTIRPEQPTLQGEAEHHTERFSAQRMARDYVKVFERLVEVGASGRFTGSSSGQ